jgi:hypothetical protein
VEKLTFPLTLYNRTNLTGTSTSTKVESEEELVAALEREADATPQNAQNFAKQILSGADISLTVREREVTLYAKQD